MHSHDTLHTFLSSVDRGSKVPLYRQMVQGIRDAIEAGALQAGDRLPSERRLAERLGFSRTTVQAAYGELIALGFLHSVPGSGTFVVGRPTAPAPASASPLEQGFAKRRTLAAGTFLEDLMRGAANPPEYGFEVGMPDPGLLPLREFELVILDLFARRSREVLSYSPTEGTVALRTAIAGTLLPMRGLRGVDPEHIMIVTGSMQGLDLVGKLFIQPGDAVVVENPTFPGAIQTFRSLDARIVAVPVDGDGMQVDRIESMLQGIRPKLIYTQPTLQNPTGAIMSRARRRDLLELAARWNVPVLEDDAYGLLADGPPGAAGPLPLRAEDDSGLVIYLSTLSKVVSPGLRVGYLVADARLIRELSRFKQLADLHTSTVSQLLVEGWLSTGDVRGHLQRCRTAYRQRIRAALDQMGDGTALRPFLKPEGGFYLFARLRDGLNAVRVRTESLPRGISFAPGAHFSSDGSFADHLRLCVAARDVPIVRSGIQRLLRLVEQMEARDRFHRAANH